MAKHSQINVLDKKDSARIKPSYEKNHQKGKKATKEKNVDKLTNPNPNVGDVSSIQFEVL